MFRLINTYLIYAVLIAACAGSALAQQEATPVTGGISAGVVIKNQARATYQDPTGKNFVVNSPIVSITVVSVTGIVVTPDDPQPSGVVLPNEQITRLFRACNTGNTPDTFTLTRSIVSAPSTLVALYWDIDGTGTVTTPDIAITLNQTASPTIPAGDCIGILAVIDTGNVKLNDPVTVGITVKTNAPSNNGPQKDDGTIINKTGETAKITDPSNPSLPPIKLVENKDQFTSTAGSIVNYSISFRNRGSVPAINVLLSDDLPAQIDYVPGTMKLGTASLTDISDADEAQVINNRRLEIKLAKVDPDQAILVTFQAKLNDNVIPGVGIINTAQVSGDNIGTSIKTSKTKVVINPIGTVYAGYSNGAVPISNAKVTLTTDKDGLNLLPVPGTGFDPNPTNSNPFMTDTQGHFSFTLGPNQVGAVGAPVTYYVNVAAQGYRPRLVEIKIQPSPANPDLYTVDVVSVDGQPISQAGNFKLTSTNVSLVDIAAVVLNIPMFETATLQLTKVADKQRAEIGEMISYRLEAQNSTAQTFTAVKLQDTLPLSFAYIPGTARVQVGGTPAFAIEPTITNNLMVFNIGDLAGGSRVTITYRLRVGANAKQGEQINSVIATGVYPNGDPITTVPAKAPVLVGMGQFSMRQIIIGRVFEDTNGNGLFEKCDRPVAGVRVYMNNGTSVITD